MTVKRSTLLPALLPTLLGWGLLSCQVEDQEARKYFREDLAQYLNALVEQVCEIKYNAAPAASGRIICPATGTTSLKAPRIREPSYLLHDKDSEVRKYIRYKLEPYLDSLSYQLCHVKFRASPAAPGGIICPGPPEGYKKPPGNGAP